MQLTISNTEQARSSDGKRTWSEEGEIASIHMRTAITNLVQAHALSSMYAANGNAKFAHDSLNWFASIEVSLTSAKHMLLEATGANL